MELPVTTNLMQYTGCVKIKNNILKSFHVTWKSKSLVKMGSTDLGAFEKFTLKQYCNNCSKSIYNHHQRIQKQFLVNRRKYYSKFKQFPLVPVAELQDNTVHTSHFILPPSLTISAFDEK